MESLITILGPTAVGKTELTLRLAEALNGVVISGDAYQIYRGLNIGTAKPTAEELRRVPHRLIDIRNAEDSYSVADFQNEASRAITAAHEIGQMPILSGGTGFYVQSLLEGFDFSVEGPDTDIRERLEHMWQADGESAVLAYGNELAGKGNITLRFTDKHRLFRAIELMEQGNYEALIHQTKAGLSYEGPVMGLRRNREELYKRINLRVNIMVDQGLFEEVEALLDSGVSPHCQAFKGIGYKEVVAYFQGQCTKSEAISAIQQNTRRFAKRQITWYKRMPYITWLDCDNRTSDSIYEEAMALIQTQLMIGQ
ncbi:tRNA (adenosine(37)-N6)-dimethylallyltransferase MiaA [Veillonella sp.]|uniref:tRNA (adenosine(37)-N6)-dimethylallyltransferase MiaA n=1 Tax=Veillonella sp. TaxID=1926307 RepID=UPI0025CC39D0|nr:tRNA (adenosine(37)-N6)-dimethylallyltransferase MiaA [Veillonella sp.]